MDEDDIHQEETTWQKQNRTNTMKNMQKKMGSNEGKIQTRKRMAGEAKWRLKIPKSNKENNKN
ncbi:uncharacterized protein G2W53_025483 [Senna tora]|uniref:Uncharacterized protein n=1 Tax=Senna tora TaxID=362788 RepID=A0A834TDP5_9FABA|nr:uncharacterized protein G2W53_025483 [Senna tora]